MPKKIPFRVIYCSGWEDDYLPKDLEVHSPFIKGWRSPRYCLYPQELVLRIDPPARIRKLQLLSHQYMIASKIDLYIGHLPSDAHTSIDSAQFIRLGYISLSDNEQTGYRSRELKSVNLDCVGHLVKLVLQPNHINRLNLFNQVSLVALNVIGDPILNSIPRTRVGVASSLPNHVTHYVAKGKQEALSEVVHSYLPSLYISQDGAPDPIVLGTINKPSHIPLMDDLGFAVAQDPRTADLIRKLDAKKASAVEDEKFEYAKQLKQVIDELQKIGEVLCRYEVEKKLAIEREDYDTAKEKKTQLDDIRCQVYERLGIQGLLDNNGGSLYERHKYYHHNEGSHPRVKRSPLFNEEYSPHGSTQGPALSPIPISLPPISRRDNVDHTPSPPPSRSHNYSDDRPLPALVQKTEKIETLQEHQEVDGEGVEGEESEGKLEPLTEKQQNEVPTAVEVFGMDWMEHIYAKQYNVREDGIQQIIKDLESKGEVCRKETSTIVRATCQVLGKALKDTVMSTFSMSLDLLNHLIGPFCQKHRLGRPDLSFIVDKVVPILLVRTGDMTSRIHTASMDVIMELAQHPQVKSFAMIGPLLVHPFKQRKPPWRLAQSRVELLDRFVRDVGLDSSGITLKKLMEFLCPLLIHSHGNVRDGAIKLVHDLYRMNGSDVRRMLPVADDSISRKKTLWKTVFEGFDRIDGVPTLAEKEANAKAAQKAKSDEIHKLQEQVLALRELAAQGNQVSEREVESVLDQSVNSDHPGPSICDDQSVSGQKHRMTATDNDPLDTTCVFCGEQRREFADNGMESHYLKECPMIQSCPHCTQVIEISGLTKHWLTECEAKERFRECPNCSEAILGARYDRHVGGCKQKRSEDGNARCPLCHTNVQDGEEGWKSHLMGTGVKACHRNPRKKGSVVAVRKPAAKKGVGATGVRGSMIPRPGGGRGTHKTRGK